MTQTSGTGPTMYADRGIGTCTAINSTENDLYYWWVKWPNQEIQRSTNTYDSGEAAENSLYKFLGE